MEAQTQSLTQYTRCPQCETAFKVTEKMLEMAKGKVRCGACLSVFQAKEHLLRPVSEKLSTPSVSEALHQAPAFDPAEIQEPAAENQGQLVDAPLEEKYQAEPPAEEPIEELTEEHLEQPTPEESIENINGESTVQKDFEDTDYESELAEESEEAAESEVAIAAEMDIGTETPESAEAPTSEAIDIEEQLDEIEEFDEIDLTEDLMEVDLSAEEPIDVELAENVELPEPDEMLDLDDLLDSGDMIGSAEMPNSDEMIDFDESLDLDAPQETDDLMHEASNIDAADIADPKMSFDNNLMLDAADEEQTQSIEPKMPTQPDLEPVPDIDEKLEAIEENENFEQLADNLTQQINQTDTVPDPLDEFEERVEVKQTGLRNALISVAILGLIAISAYQFWQNRQQLAWSETWGAATKTVCGLLPCDLKPRRDVSKIRLRQRIVTPAENNENLLDVKILLINEADFDQPYPRISIKFSNSYGEEVALKQFLVSDYFPQKQGQMMPKGAEIHISFTTELPHPDALGFEFDFD